MVEQLNDNIFTLLSSSGMISINYYVYILNDNILFATKIQHQIHIRTSAMQ